jgi:hypothetical protein
MSTSHPPDPPPPLRFMPSRERLTGGTLDTREWVRWGAGRKERVLVAGRVADGCGCGALEGRSRLVGVIVGRVQADTRLI